MVGNFQNDLLLEQETYKFFILIFSVSITGQKWPVIETSIDDTYFMKVC